MKAFMAGICCALASGSTATLAAAPSDVQVLERHTLGGEGGWDFLTFDEVARRVFVTRGEHVMVVDADKGTLLGDIRPVKHAHGVALVPALKRGYVSNGHGDSVTVFDLDTLKIVGEIPVTGKDPDAILFDPASRHVFVFNGHSNSVTVVDPATSKVVATMNAPGRPEFAVSDGAGHIYFNLEDKSRIVMADAMKAKVVHDWPLGNCQAPTGLAIDVAHARLFSACANNQMVVLDAHDGHLVTTVTIGKGPDATAYDVDTATIYSSNGDGTLTVVHQDDADHYRVVANVATPPRSKTLALDPKTHRVYLGAAEFGATPAATVAEPEPKPLMKADSFALIVVGKP
jgi:YVTN family beta-propeller protein